MNVGKERFLEVYGRQKVIVQTECLCQSVLERRGCNRKRATADCWQTVWRDEQLQCERRP